MDASAPSGSDSCSTVNHLTPADVDDETDAVSDAELHCNQQGWMQQRTQKRRSRQKQKCVIECSAEASHSVTLIADFLSRQVDV